MHRIVIADTGPLIALAGVRQLELLPQLFGTVTVTKQVAQELTAAGDFPDSPLVEAALAGPWLKTVALEQAIPGTWADATKDLMNLHQIDLGEASAIAYAQHMQGAGDHPLLLIDDHRGRAAVQHAGLPMIGTVGLLLLARQADAVAEIGPMLEAMRMNGYFFSQRLIDAALAQAAMQREQQAQPFRGRDASFGGEGLTAELQGTQWEQLRDLTYKGRGS